MFTHDDYLPSPTPFWFASEQLLTDVLCAEIEAVNKLLDRYPNLPDIFDAPNATGPQRNVCFELLARRELMDVVYEMFAGRHEQSPSLGDSESKALSGTQNLLAGDAPAWAREVKEVVQLLPYRVNGALPKSLRKGRYDANDPAQAEAIESLSTVEQIQRFTKVVLDQQLLRLERRWSAEIVRAPEIVVQTLVAPSDTPPVKPKKRKTKRRRDRQRVFRDKLIAELDDIAQTPEEFIRLMDEHKIQPQPTWKGWGGTWVQAYKDPRLRALIHKDKSRALARYHKGRNT